VVALGEGEIGGGEFLGGHRSDVDPEPLEKRECVVEEELRPCPRLVKVRPQRSRSLRLKNRFILPSKNWLREPGPLGGLHDCLLLESSTRAVATAAAVGGFVCSRSLPSPRASGSVKESRMADLHQRKTFEIRAEWDSEAEVWWCSNDELPLTTEAPTFEQLVSRVLEIAPELAAENGLAAPGDEIEVNVTA
jgi:hypothetical protein